MKTILTVYVLTTYAAFSQMLFGGFGDPAAMGQQVAGTVEDVGMVPTNISGLTVYGWWVADDLGTTWPDRGPNGFTLGNEISGERPTKVSGVINGKAVARFDGVDDRMRNLNHKKDQPHEIWVVAALTNAGAVTQRYFESTNASYRASFVTDATLMYLVASGGSATFAIQNITNRYMVFRFLFNSSSSFVHTNGVQMYSGNVGGSGSMQGLTLGSRYDGSGPAKMHLAEFISTTGTPTTAASSNLFYYLTNKYAISY